MNQLSNLPPIKWAMIHPRIAAWAILSIGMVAILVVEARDVGLEVGNWIALVVATVLVAGLCIWIVSWEDVDEGVRVSTTEMEAVKIDTTGQEVTDTPDPDSAETNA